MRLVMVSTERRWSSCATGAQGAAVAGDGKDGLRLVTGVKREMVLVVRRGVNGRDGRGKDGKQGATVSPGQGVAGERGLKTGAAGAQGAKVMLVLVVRRGERAGAQNGWEGCDKVRLVPLVSLGQKARWSCDESRGKQVLPVEEMGRM